MVTIKYDDLLDAFAFVSSAAPTEHSALLSMDTGKIYWVSALSELEEEELPDDLETSDRYLEIPHKNDLDLGRQLAFRFVDERLPAQSRRVADIFHSQGAYRRFKDLLASEGRLEEWCTFENEATEQAIRDWCRDNDLHLERASSRSV